MYIACGQVIQPSIPAGNVLFKHFLAHHLPAFAKLVITFARQGDALPITDLITVRRAEM